MRSLQGSTKGQTQPLKILASLCSGWNSLRGLRVSRNPGQMNDPTWPWNFLRPHKTKSWRAFPGSRCRSRSSSALSPVTLTSMMDKPQVSVALAALRSSCSKQNGLFVSDSSNVLVTSMFFNKEHACLVAPHSSQNKYRNIPNTRNTKVKLAHELEFCNDVSNTVGQ